MTFLRGRTIMDDRILQNFLAGCRDGVFTHIKSYLHKAAAGLPSSMKTCVLDYPYRRGKALRPALLVIFCGACGGRPTAALRLGAAYQLLEDWGIGRDDLLDGALMRRGKPALQQLYGAARAINSLDMLHVFVFDMLYSYCGLSPALYGKAHTLFTRASVVTLGGQHLDIEARDIPLADFTPRMYYRIAARKTAFYTVTAPCLLGLAAAGRGPAERDIAAFGEALGTAFQIIDDVLDVENDGAGGFGKAPGNDIMEAKRTLVAAEAWRRLPPSRRKKMAVFYALPAGARTAAAAAALRRDILASGAPEACRRRALRLSAKAELILRDKLLPHMRPRYAGMLAAFVRRLSSRSV